MGWPKDLASEKVEFVGSRELDMETDSTRLDFFSPLSIIIK